MYSAMMAGPRLRRQRNIVSFTRLGFHPFRATAVYPGLTLGIRPPDVQASQWSRPFRRLTASTTSSRASPSSTAPMSPRASWPRYVVPLLAPGSCATCSNVTRARLTSGAASLRASRCRTGSVIFRAIGAAHAVVISLRESLGQMLRLWLGRPHLSSQSYLAKKLPMSASVQERTQGDLA